MISRLLSLRTLVLAALVALAPAAEAQTPPWVPLGPFGGPVDAITADPARPGVLYATTPAGVYKTADAGASWAAIYLRPLPLGRVTVDPLHPSTLYLTGSYLDAPVLKSVDGGAHWSPAAAGLPLYYPSILAVDPARPRRLYVGTNGFGFWRSEDAGASWQLASDGLPGGPHASVLSIAVASRPAGTVLAATTRGVYRSADGGDSWRLAAGLPADLAEAVAFAPSDPRTAYASVRGAGFYRSTDGGVSWRRVLKTPAYASEISASPRSPRLLYARYYRTLFRSADGGEHWVQIRRDAQVTSVTADPFAPAAVWAGILPGTSTGGVWRSGNQGQTWAQRSQGLTAIATTSLAIDPEDPARLWTTTSAGLYRSGNRGARWARVPLPPGTASADQAGIGSSSRAFVLAAANPSSPPFVWRTKDDGASWERRYGPFLPDSLLRIAPSEPSTLYVLSADRISAAGLYRSTDGGEIWQLLLQSSSLLGCGVGDLAVFPSNASVLYLGGSGPTAFGCKPPALSRVLRSEDGGASWTDVSAGLPPDTVVALAVDPRDPRTVYASVAFLQTGAGAGVWKTTDGGASWTRTASEAGDEKVTALLTPLSGRVYAATEDGRVFRSDDGGATWEDWSAGLRVTGISGLVADPDDPRRIYAVTANGVWTLNEAD
jgi:photosystem II stability/assembly factor-like uncharacterized protein